jgi:hypothetical protein
MLRARLGTHQGAVRAFFAPFHVDISATQQSGAFARATVLWSHLVLMHLRQRFLMILY